MAKLTTVDITAGYALVTLLNSNYALIEAAMENTLSLDGTIPNAMTAVIDANSNKLINLSTPTADTDGCTKAYADGLSATAATSINGLPDVTITGTPADNEVLAYDTTSAEWINQTAAESGLLANIVEDLTPELGGALAGGSFNITAVASLTMDATLTVEDSANTDSVTFAHDGTDFNVTGTNTTALNLDGMRVDIHSGNELRIHDTTEADVIRVGHDGTDAFITITNAAALNMNLGTGRLDIHDGGGLRIMDSTNGDTLTITHDGTDVEVVSTNTTDVNFRGQSKVHIWNTADDDSLEIYHDGTAAYLRTASGDGRLKFIAENNQSGSTVTAGTSGDAISNGLATTRMVVMDADGSENCIGFNSYNPVTRNQSQNILHGDAGKMLIHDDASAYSWTVQPDSTVDLPRGTTVMLVTVGTGDTTLVEGAGVTLTWLDGVDGVLPTGNRTMDRACVASIVKHANDAWYVFGNVGMT